MLEWIKQPDSEREIWICKTKAYRARLHRHDSTKAWELDCKALNIEEYLSYKYTDVQACQAARELIVEKILEYYETIRDYAE